MKTDYQRKFSWVRRGCQASQRKGLTSGEVGDLPGKFGELPGKFGKLPGNLWIAVKFRSERTSGEVAEKLPGKFGELPGKSGDFPEARGSLTPSQRLAKFVSKTKASKQIRAKSINIDQKWPWRFRPKGDDCFILLQKQSLQTNSN